MGSAAVSSYAVIMDAFGKIVVGSSVYNRYDTGTAFSTVSKILPIDWSSGEAVATYMEQLFQNITLSMLSDDGLMCVSPCCMKSHSNCSLTLSYLATIPQPQIVCQ